MRIPTVRASGTNTKFKSGTRGFARTLNGDLVKEHKSELASE